MNLSQQDPRSSVQDPGTPAVLVRRVCGLGDLVLTLPFLKAISLRHPGVAIHMIGHEGHLELLLAAGYISRGFPEEQSGWHLLFAGTHPTVAPLRPDPGSYDAVYLFVDDPEGSPLVLSLSGVLGERLHPIPARPPPGEPIHSAIEPFLHVRGLPVPPGIGGQAFLQLAKAKEGDGRPGLGLKQRGSAASGVVLVHPGSGSPKKNWPPDRFAELLREISTAFRPLRPCLIQGPADHAATKAILDAYDLKQELGVVAGLRPLDLARLLSEATLFVGNDSGVTHLCAALGVPTIAIFGPSDPAQWSPLGPSVRVVLRDFHCRPCHLQGERPCPFHVCERFPSVEEVKAAMRDLLRPAEITRPG